ncbi:hypothetical protein ACJ73_03906 [Blastomyces percursus]|uniref:Uncharacterized protein n=1 Tax=Blastomyces percursus TaxID=1658174 RepID=A0A1J9R8A3_9EURO|nr:hypothetical protein ACJ73_03906 [Blastomyces percursus]
MQPSSSKGVKKPWSEHNSLVQMRYRRKGTLQRMLRSYFDDCHCKGIYLVIHEDNRYFTVKFNKDGVSFPPSDKDIVSVIYGRGKTLCLQRQEKHYPPPSQTTCENYPKPQKSRKGGEGKEESHPENKPTACLGQHPPQAC